MLTILVDMDNVVANLICKWLDTYNSEFDDNLTAEQITSWNIEQHATKCSPHEFHGIIERAGFFSDLKLIPHSPEVTGRLQAAGHEIYFVTATPYNNPTCGYDKYNWVERYFPHIGKSRVIQAHHKNMVKGDILFDDGPINLQNFPGIKIAMNMPYNQHVKVDYRVDNWLVFETVIHQIAIKKVFSGGQ